MESDLVRTIAATLRDMDCSDRDEMVDTVERVTRELDDLADILLAGESEVVTRLRPPGEET